MELEIDEFKNGENGKKQNTKTEDEQQKELTPKQKIQRAKNKSPYDTEEITRKIIKYSRGNVIANEEQFLLQVLVYTTGWLKEDSKYTNSVLIGTSAGGKTHLNKNVNDLYKKIDPIEPRDDGKQHIMYISTTGSAKSFIYDDDWNRSIFAPLDEWNQLDDKLKEFMKKVTGEDGGYEYKVTKENSGEDNRNAKTIFKKPMPFSFQYAQFSMDNEMWTRLFKNYIEESESIHRAIGRRQMDHKNIEIESSEYNYIYDTDQLKDTLQEHIKHIPMGVSVKIPEWVWWSTREIFDHARSEVNRIYGMITNMVRSSALINYHDRPTTQKEGETKIVAKPQDVANVLSCRETLIGTTHEIEPRKWRLVKIIQKLSNQSVKNGATLDEIQQYIEEGDKIDMSRLKKDQLKQLLKELDQNFIIRIRNNFTEDNETLYQFRSVSSVGVPRLEGLMSFEYNQEEPFIGVRDPHNPYKYCIDPIHDREFTKTVEEFKQFLVGNNYMSEIMGDKDTEQNNAQESLTETNKTTDEKIIEDVIEKEIIEHIEENTEGQIFKGDKHEEEHLLGVLDKNQDITEIDESELDGSIFDYRDPLWYHPTLPDGIADTNKQAKQNIVKRIEILREKGIIGFEGDGKKETTRMKVKINNYEIDDEVAENTSE